MGVTAFVIITIVVVIGGIFVTTRDTKPLKTDKQ